MSMDFGRILEDWERREKKPRGEADRPEAPGRSPKGGTASGKAGGQAADASSARAAPPAPGRGERRDSPARKAQEAWMERHGVPDADHRERQSGPGGREALSRAELDAIPSDGSLDLHGMTAGEAEAALDGFFARAEALGWRKVLIIHGKGLHSKGAGVLGGVVRAWLRRRASAGRSGSAGAGQGGSGVTWVLLKGRDQRSR